jgi:hypothetical protein
VARAGGPVALPRRGRVGRHVQAVARGRVAAGDPVVAAGDPVEGDPVAAMGARMGSAMGGAAPAEPVVRAAREWLRRPNRPGRSRFRRR